MAYDNPPLPPGLTLWTKRVPPEASRDAIAQDHAPDWAPGKIALAVIDGQRFAFRDEWHTWTYRNGERITGHFEGVTLYDATGYDETAAPPTSPPASAPLLEGVDVSAWQGSIDWLSVATAKQFTYVRLADGVTHPDERFDENWVGACNHRLARGAYQFFRPEQSAVAQAELFLAKLAGDFGELAPALDAEVLDGVSPAAAASAMSVWIDTVVAATLMTPVIYTSPNFWLQMPAGLGLEQKAALWLADYSGRPRVPKGWPDWAFWQYAGKGSCPGIVGAVDLDRLNGTSLPGLG